MKEKHKMDMTVSWIWDLGLTGITNKLGQLFCFKILQYIFFTLLFIKKDQKNRRSQDMNQEEIFAIPVTKKDKSGNQNIFFTTQKKY